MHDLDDQGVHLSPTNHEGSWASGELSPTPALRTSTGKSSTTCGSRSTETKRKELPRRTCFVQVKKWTCFVLIPILLLDNHNAKKNQAIPLQYTQHFSRKLNANIIIGSHPHR